MSPLVTAACLIGALCWGTAAASDSVQEGNGTPDLKLLFVGNSLLYYNGGAYKVQLWSQTSLTSHMLVQAKKIGFDDCLSMCSK